jgi:NADH-quinone oxidoreductase subunit N
MNATHGMPFLMLILMLSMAGVPPLLGFWAKWSVLSQVIQADMVWLAIIAVIFAIIGAFYYLRIIKTMYFERAQDLTPIEINTEMHVVLSANALIVFRTRNHATQFDHSMFGCVLINDEW